MVDGGWFSWDLKALPRRPQELRVKYWGGDSGGRESEILVDGQELTTVTLHNNKPGQYFEQAYAIPERLTQRKATVTVTFRARLGKMAGGVFGCAVLSRVSSDGDHAAR